MALDGIFLHKIIPNIAERLPARIQKIYQISSNEILLQCHHEGRFQILISCHSVYNRILITDRNYPTPSEPSNFVMLLRKYLEGSSIQSVKQEGLDRWCTFTINHHNIIGDIEEIKLVVELMGKYANVILVDSSNKIIDALKRIPPFENTRRIVHPGATFIPTPPQNKKNPFQSTLIDTNQSLTQQFDGFSPFLSKEIEFRMQHGETFDQIMQEIQDSKQIYIANHNNDAVFHCIELKHIGKCKSYPLFEGLDVLYYHKEEKERIKDLVGDVFKVVQSNLKHQSSKLPRLQKELDEANQCEKYNHYGSLLFTYANLEEKGLSKVEVYDYETNTNIQVPLDIRYSIKQNANRYFQKYQKQKRAQQFIQQQIEICKREIDYFEGLLIQLQQADFQSALETKQELIGQGYIHEQKKKKLTKKQLPKVNSITLENGVTIHFGKNNLQNDLLTWQLAKKNDLWLHAKDYHGSHVVIHESQPDEYTLRVAANIAAYFSAGRNSSSVPVNYCPVSKLKKIPGAKPGMVQLTNYKTIYIDPNEDELYQLKLID